MHRDYNRTLIHKALMGLHLFNEHKKSPLLLLLRLLVKIGVTLARVCE